MGEGVMGEGVMGGGGRRRMEERLLRYQTVCVRVCVFALVCILLGIKVSRFSRF